MADEILTFRTIRVVDDSGNTSQIIADQSEDVVTFEAGANVNLLVVDDDRIVVSTQSPIGFTGSRGYAGSIGFKGSQGDRGYTGSQGVRGFAGSFGYTGSIGFTGSQGFQGSRGNIGFTGSQGPAGAPSQVPGPVGFTGSQGLFGYTGSEGPAGPQGNIGLTGSQGLQGYTGSRGVVGFSGSQGGVGFTGSVGYTGSIGFSGSRGSGGYTGSRGFTGSRGIQGIQGVQGLRGYTGSRGAQGQIGETGYTGSRGFVGSTGYTGSRGPIGPQGQTGVGLTGSVGPQGPQGPQGEPAEAFRTFRMENDDGSTSLIIADQPEDVMTFVAGDGMFIEFNEATDTITFVSKGGNGGGGNANVIPALTVLNNEPGKDSFIAYDSDTGVLEYTPIDISDLATQGNVDLVLRLSKDYTNAAVAAEAQIRADADQALGQYVQDEVNRIDAELASNVIVINDTIDQANVYLQGLIQLEANIRAISDITLQLQIDALTETAANILVDLDANVEILQQELQQIEANSIARDETLQANIDVVADGLAQEILDRIAGDQAVQDNLDANITLVNGRIDIVEQDLSDETNARISGDALLQGQIDVLDSGLTDVNNNLAQEIIDRELADEALQTQITLVEGNITVLDNRLDQEILDRIAGDQQLQANLDLEVSVINGELQLLSNAIQNEANIRANADSALSGRINVEALRNDGQDGEIDDLDIRVTELENRVEFSIDYGAELTELGQPNTQAPDAGEFIPTVGFPGGVASFTADGQGGYAGGEQCTGLGFRAVNVTGSGTGLRVSTVLSPDGEHITGINILTPGQGYQVGDQVRLEPNGVCFTPIDYVTLTITNVTSGVVVNDWQTATMLYLNAVDDEGTFHFLDAISQGDDLVFQHRTLDSYCRYEVTANVILTGDTANVFVTPVASNGVIEPANGSLQSDYIVQFFPNVAGDVPSYDYVDTQDDRRVLKTGDEMSGTLHMKGGDVVAYGNTGSRIRAVQGADVDIADGGSLVISGTGSVTTNKISNYGGSSIYFDFGGSNRFQIASSGSYFLNTPAKYTYQSAPGVGNIDNFDLIHKGYLDTRINNLDLGNTYVAKSGDTMSGTLAFNPSTQTAIKINPTDGSLTTIDLFDNNNTQLTTVDVVLNGNTSENRFRILGGENSANTMVAWTARGDFVTNVPMDMNNNKITSVGNPTEEQDAANKRYVDSAITQSQADIEDIYVNVAGDTMTGLLTITGGGIRVSNSNDVTVEGGDVKATNGGSVVTNTLNSVGNSNLSLQRDNQTKILLGSASTIAYQPIKYNAQYGLTDDLHLINKGYVDGNFIKNGGTTVLKGQTTIDGTNGQRLLFKGPASGLGFQITRNNGIIMFYQEGGDIRLNNTTFDSDYSVVNRKKGDERYGLKDDFVQKSGDTMTGKLTTQALEVTGNFDINNTNSYVNFNRQNVWGKLQYRSETRFQIGSGRAEMLGELRIVDGLDSDTGLPVDGRINMNNHKIVNLLNPTAAQDAATKNYVDEAVAGGSGEFIKANGDTDITTESTVTLKGVPFNIKSENSGTGFRILRSDGQTLFYSFGNDIRIANNIASSSNSVLSRNQMDLRYLNQDGLSLLTNTTTIKANSNAPFYIQNGANNTSNFFKVLNYSGSELFGVDGDGMVRVPRTPSSDTHVANKKYVDDQIASSGSQKTWPGRRFRFTGYAQQSSVGVGNFSPTNANDTTQHLYFSSTDYDGIKIREGSPDFTPGVTMPGTVYKLSGGYWNAVGFFTWGGSSTDYRNDYIKLTSVTWKQKPSLSSGQIYAIVLGGRWG